MSCLCYFLEFCSSSRVHLKAVICYRFLLTMTFVRTHIFMSPKPAKYKMSFFSKNLHRISHNLFTESGLFALSWTEPWQGTGFADCHSLILPLWKLHGASLGPRAEKVTVLPWKMWICYKRRDMECSSVKNMNPNGRILKNIH